VRIPPTTNPLHIARAYRLAEAERSTSSGQASQADPTSSSITERLGGRRVAQAEKTARLVSAVVAGGIDFTASTPRPSPAALPFYQRPADRNDAATALTAGRIIDATA